MRNTQYVCLRERSSESRKYFMTMRFRKPLGWSPFLRSFFSTNVMLSTGFVGAVSTRMKYRGRRITVFSLISRLMSKSTCESFSICFDDTSRSEPASRNSSIW